MLAAPLVFALMLEMSMDASVVMLGHDDWETREAASSRLVSLWPLSKGAVGRAASSPDAEVRKRADDCLWRARSAEKVRFVESTLGALKRETGYGDWPWIDSLPEGYPDRAQLVCDCLAWVREYVWPEKFSSPHWRDYRLATEHYCWMLRGYFSEADILLLLRRMVDGDRRQWLRSSKTWEWAGRPE